MTDEQGMRVDNDLAPARRCVSETAADMIGCLPLRHHVASVPDNFSEVDQRAEISCRYDDARSDNALTTRQKLTDGFAALSEQGRNTVIRTVGDHDQWTRSGSCDADHDFDPTYTLANGAWTQAAPARKEIRQTMVWLIDCPDQLSTGSCPRPWNPMAGERVITLMLATEY